MRKEVVYVQTHSVIFVPQCGNFKNTLTPKEFIGIKMFYTGDGVEVTYKNQQFLIPSANIVCTVFKELQAEEKPSIIKPLSVA